MTATWLISDTHFGHRRSLEFMREDGVSRLRPFDTLEEMDELMVERWNSTVRPGDRVYHLGDVAINRACVKILDRLNGRKVLVRGNHDLFSDQYAGRFDDIRGSHKLDKFILSHYPLHPDSISGWAVANIHGHLHDKQVKLAGNRDPRYFNVSVESQARALINVPEFTPINFDVIREFYNKPGPGSSGSEELLLCPQMMSEPST